MPDPLCRLAVQHGTLTVDLALPNDAPVGLLLPSIVDLVHRDTATADEGQRWHLSRVGREWIDPATSLHDNAIRDGELLVLTTAAAPPPVGVPGEPWHTVVDSAETGYAPRRLTTTAACLSTSALGAAVLMWSGIVTHATGHVITSGGIAVASAVGAVAMRRAHPDPIFCVTLGVIAVVFSAATGFLAVPAGPSPANALLAAAVACSTSVLLLRVTRCGAICLTALATFTALTSVASACGVAWTLPVSTMGAALSTLSVGALGAAARLSIAVAGLAPAMPSSAHCVAETDPAQEASRSVSAHHTLTGLVVGSAGAAALGAVLVASGCVDGGRHWPKGALFAAVVGLVMVLRARTHIDMRRRTALVVGGMAASAAGLILVVVSAPGQGSWVCLLVTAVGLSMLGAALGATVNPLAGRAVEVLECLALASVVPLACWVVGLYGLIRGLSLP
jgi:type VII secretion integral membrane protein EccD